MTPRWLIPVDHLAVDPSSYPHPPCTPHQAHPPLPLPWRGDDDSNCMYYTTTCNPMGHGSIGLTLSLPARPPASHLRVPRRTACSEDDAR